MNANKILLLFCSVLISISILAQIPQPVRQLLRMPMMQGATFTLAVRDLDSDEWLYAFDEQIQVTPASVLKTVTTATALELLGSDYRYPTSLSYSGAIENGVLEGNLYITGSGDPSLGSSHLKNPNQFMQDWLQAIKAAGIRKIQGAVIADARIFDHEGTSLKWVQEDLGSYYGAGSYGLSVFDNLYKLYFQTAGPGSVPRITGSEPDVSALNFYNNLSTTVRSSDSAYIIGFPLSGDRYLYGTLPANKSTYALKGDIPDPPLFLAQYLTKQLQNAGIPVTDEAGSLRNDALPAVSTAMQTPLITTYSPPLSELITICNGVSHNLYADALLKTIGLNYKENQSLSSFERGVRVMQDWWKSKGFNVSSFKVYDGSGLAPANKVTASFINDMLVYMATEAAERDIYIASLPEAGVSGSVRNFLKGSSLQGQAFLKSGGMSGVRSYAGYIRQDDKTYAVAVFATNYNAPMSQMTRQLEKLLLQLFQIPLGSSDR